MADHTEARAVIHADPGTVADVIGDVEAYPQWTEQMRSSRILTRDQADWPAEVEFVVDAGIVRDTYVLDYTWDVEEDGTGVVSWTLLRSQSLTAMNGSYTLTAVPEGTEVTYRLAVDTRITMPALVRRKAEKSIVAAALDGLKRHCEN
ncbi:hypothetical protein KEM60_02315 [Austwickia sp. TVS 96-490-7B]|uniref:SRPBCC family protein n=1 Tax=Austwickia sp. TVS 96-490-7B TaxID=2830843 RepID=UPI001C59B451|nr:SRPBCC family protein [Austwickia sp. TVS 96-490-7B]MBW3086104.1 hypothetical protein [Austwickia sp. TVS 96-490-7B]